MADTDRPRVGLTKYEDDGAGLRRAIELCDGFAALDRGMRVVIKPNLVWCGGTRRLPKYGMITTTRLIEDMIGLLRDHGCTDITLGEGSVAAPELRTGTRECARWTGVDRVCRRHGVRIVDLNDDETVTVKLDGITAHIARTAAEADFLVNMPVLKTHTQTKVSLGLKNLKGCLPMKTKKAFHGGDLEKRIALLSTHLKTHLSVVDGIYALEFGPVANIGGAVRVGIVAASTDVAACDAVGATLLGYTPRDVDHLREYCDASGATCDLKGIDVAGESVDAHIHPLKHGFELEELLRLAKLSGVTIQDPGKRWCSGCALNAGAALFAFSKDNAGRALEGVELCMGPDVRARDDSKMVLAFGQCAIKANRDRAGAVYVRGCAPTAGDIWRALVSRGVKWHRRPWQMLVRGLKALGSELGVYQEDFAFFRRYDPPEFDPAHFAPRRT